jgi:hypothetical protein
MAKKGALWKEIDHWAADAKNESSRTQPTLRVGIMESTADTPHPKDGKPIGDIAFFNEYGTITTPARSFIRDWVDGNIDNIAKQLGNDVLRVLMTDEAMRTALTKRGSAYRKAIIRRIKQRIPPPNAPSTLAQKHGDTPLIDTQTLIDAIRYEVK